MNHHTLPPLSDITIPDMAPAAMGNIGETSANVNMNRAAMKINAQALSFTELLHMFSDA
jgi:acetylglutamate kinase